MFAKQDSFKPFYSFKKSVDGWRAFIFRITVALVIGYYSWYLFRSPVVLHDLLSIGKNSHEDLIAWGKSKIAFDFTLTQSQLKHDKESVEESQINNTE